VIGQLNFLEKSTRLDLANKVHQCAHFSANAKTSHKMAVLHIGRILMETKMRGLSSDQMIRTWSYGATRIFVEIGR